MLINKRRPRYRRPRPQLRLRTTSHQRRQLVIRQLRRRPRGLHLDRLRSHPIRRPQVQIRRLHVPIHRLRIQGLQQRMSLLRRPLHQIHPSTPLVTKHLVLLPVPQRLSRHTVGLRKPLLRRRLTLHRSSTQPLQILLLPRSQHHIISHTTNTNRYRSPNPK